MLKLRINPVVAKDLKNIRDYIAEDNEDYAAKTIKEIYGKFENLQMFPGMGADLSKRLETAYLLLFLRVWTSLRFLFGILIVFYSNSQIKSCLYTFLYKNHGSIWFYMCSTVQSLQTVLNGVINRYQDITRVFN